MPFIIDKKVEETMMLGPQLQHVTMVVPTALTSVGNSLHFSSARHYMIYHGPSAYSVADHGTFPSPIAYWIVSFRPCKGRIRGRLTYEATKQIMATRTIMPGAPTLSLSN